MTYHMSPPIERCLTLVQLLRARAVSQPDQELYRFLIDGEDQAVSLTYGELDRQARAVGAMLQQECAGGERALLLYPPGLEYIAALFGCLYAGVVPVPAYPPNPARLERTLPRLLAMVHDARPAVMLTTAPLLSLAQAIAAPELQGVRWYATDTLADDLIAGWCEPEADETALALLQYTSGSTATPKGVMLTHRNLLHNLALIQRGLETSDDSRGVFWLPFYHDMGLIGGLLQPIYCGGKNTLISPVSFLQRPARWLEAITHTQATISGAPNFAYDLCVRKISAEQRQSLDLRSWRVAFNGAEPIRAETLERFAAAFAPCGFRRAAFYPCYGLAEATVFVSGAAVPDPPVVQIFDGPALERHHALIASPESETGRVLVSSGRPQQQVAIVDPETLHGCGPGQVGEIWVAGPSVAQGYWNRPQETRHAFQAYVGETGAGPFLRTGDLGFIRQDQLFVTGRLKDLIIIRGRNYYPQDIELTVEQSHPALRAGAGAVFMIEGAGNERLVIVQEVDRRSRNSDAAAVIAAIRAAVAEAHELYASAVVLIRHGSIAKTSSGKIQRSACRDRYLTGQLEVIESSSLPDAPAPDGEHVSREMLLDAPPHERRHFLGQYLQAQVARLLHEQPSRVSTAAPVTSLGFDSLMVIDMQHRIEADLGILLPPASFFQRQSLDQIAQQMLDLLNSTAAARPALVHAAQPTAITYLLSHGQQALWYLHQLSPQSSAYNIASAIRIRAELNPGALRQAFVYLVERHPSLRTTFGMEAGTPFQRIHNQVEIDFGLEEAEAWTNDALNRRLLEEANQPFDLEHGPLLRLRLFRRAPQEHVLLLAVHHLVADFWSLAVVIREMGLLYEAAQTASVPSLDPLTTQYYDYVHWQAAMLASPIGERLWSYWQQQLAGDLPILNLPAARPRPPIMSYRGGAVTGVLDERLTHGLKALGRRYETTLYVVLMAAFQVLLHRYTGQDDLLVGSPMVGRSAGNLAGLVGYFINPVVLRGNAAGNPRFEDFLRQIGRLVLEAFEHQDYPFALLAERLQPERDPSRSPLFQVMFIFQQAPVPADSRLNAFALGSPGTSLRSGDLVLEPIALDQQTSQFDLTLVMAEVEGRLQISLQYNADLFEAPAMAGMVEHFQILLAGIVADPVVRLAQLPLLSAAERQLLLDGWNDTRAAFPHEQCIHELFEAQVARMAGAPAVVFGREQLSYQDLNRRANQLAHYLRRLGVGPDTLVGIYVERGLDLVVGLLGIMKAGGAYVPLDPAYPQERLALMIADAGVTVLVAQERRRHRLPTSLAQVVCIDTDWQQIAQECDENPCFPVQAQHLAYVIYTSGSTGKPKGVMVSHRNVVNFFTGMDQRIGCDSNDTLIALTSISFDICVLELFWTLARGAKIVLLDERAVFDGAARAQRPASGRPLQFSLFYFASDEAAPAQGKYRLLLEGAKFADQHEFAAIWTPERHFHAFGGLYPNPAVTSAALATITERIQIRAGSVVLPLHHPIRVAEEWSLVDNLSSGRVGVAFASGWHADDFVFFPEHYPDRKAHMLRQIETVQRLWQGEPVTVQNGAGNPISVCLYPKPIQPKLPIWLTAAGAPETFIRAGELGANVLTHLLGQTLEEVAEKIQLYRSALAQHGHDPQAGRVTLMLHTFIGAYREAVRAIVRAPFTQYLRTSIGLIDNLIRSLKLPLDLKTMSPKDMDDLLAFAFDRYFETSALFGTPDTCLPLVEQLKAIGVDEVACLIDFGVEAEAVLASLHRLNELRERANRPVPEQAVTLASQAAAHGATLMQCTPSTLRLLALAPDNLAAIGSLRALLLGGEALPSALVAQMHGQIQGQIFNMYGPTETTIWSATHAIDAVEDNIPIGRPIANTQISILDRHLQPVPIGVAGEVYIGGAGVARGYHNRPDLTAERFIPDPFATTTDDRRPTTDGAEDRGWKIEDGSLDTSEKRSSILYSPSSSRVGGRWSVVGGRLYRTGDLARYRSDGTIEFLGRIDQQVKLRGFRIELEEIEAVLGELPGVYESVVVARQDTPGDRRLVAYVVRQPGAELPVGQIRDFLKRKLPEFMIPSHYIFLPALPLTPNGKINRGLLPAPDTSRQERTGAYVAPQGMLEQTITTIWQQVLKVDRVGVDDNFFDLGGHSLLLAQVHQLLLAELKQDFPLVKLLEYPTVGAFVRYWQHEEEQQSFLQQTTDRALKQVEAMNRQKRALQRTRLIPNQG